MKAENLNLKVFTGSLTILLILLIISCGIYFTEDEKEEKPEDMHPFIKEEKKEEKTAETFLILNEKTGEIEETDAYAYALGAVAAEMPPDFHEEALKAQSLSALTRARYLKKLFEDGKGHFDSCHFSQNPDENEGFVRLKNLKELYGKNYDAYYAKMKKAADFAVSHELTYEGEPILAAYHAMSPGFTENCEAVWGKSLPYLVKRESRGDTLSPDLIKDKELSFFEVKLALNKAFPQGKFIEGSEATWIIPQSFSKGGYVKDCLAGGIATDGKKVRSALALRSSSFTIKIEDGKFIFTTKGYGHGVGLSQVGADFMARQGAKAEDILEHYYKGAQVSLAP